MGTYQVSFSPCTQLQFDNWKKVLQLKWPLAQCKQVGCTPTHWALAHFGRGEYEQSVKQMKVLLKSKSPRGNRRVRLFILLHESYMRLGNVKKAAQLLTKDHYTFQCFLQLRALKPQIMLITQLSCLLSITDTSMAIP